MTRMLRDDLDCTDARQLSSLVFLEDVACESYSTVERDGRVERTPSLDEYDALMPVDFQMMRACAKRRIV